MTRSSNSLRAVKQCTSSIVLVLTLIASDISCADNADTGPNPRQQLNVLMDKIWNWKMDQYPEFATSVGYPEGHDRWTDLSAAAIENRKQQTRRFLRELSGIDREHLNTKARLDYDVLQYDLQLAQDGDRFPHEYLRINQMEGIQSEAPYTLKISPRNTLHDYENLLIRLERLPLLIEQTIALLKAGVAAGVVQPRVPLRTLPGQIDGLLPDNVRQSPLFEAFVNMPDTLSPRQGRTIQKQAARLLSDKVYPAFKRLKTYLVKSYLPESRESIALSDLPDGEAWYRHLIAYHTSTGQTPQEIHKTGLSEVRRIHKQMERVIRESGFDGDFEEFVDYLNHDKQFFFNNRDELLIAYRDLCKRADAKMPQLFRTLPRLPYGVAPVEPHLEKSAAAAYYYPGSADAARAGMFYVNTYDLQARPKWLMQALALHEAVPGHHLQIAIAQEQAIHVLRKHMFWTAYVEGWGLYAESLGEEMDFYPDAYAEFGRLSMEMMRAIRLVVDTGMHAMGWSRQKAIDFFKQYSPTPEHDIIVEIDRYIVWPGQALAYKTGELKIRELRRYAQKKLVERFDIREFHDEILADGALPLEILERKIREWVDKKSANSD